MICEKCGNEHDGAYGSGRFCSCFCSKSRTFTTETNQKRGKSMLGKNKGKTRTLEQRKRIGDSIRGKKRSEEFKQNISTKLKGRKITWGKKISKALTGKEALHRRGEKSNFWRGGTTTINAQIRASLEYKNWRRLVFERDNYTCVMCSDKSHEGHRIMLRADHIKQFAFYPELRFDINNGRTLCDSCHRKTPTFGRKTICASQ